LTTAVSVTPGPGETRVPRAPSARGGAVTAPDASVRTACYPIGTRLVVKWVMAASVADVYNTFS